MERGVLHGHVPHALQAGGRPQWQGEERTLSDDPTAKDQGHLGLALGLCPSAASPGRAGHWGRVGPSLSPSGLHLRPCGAGGLGQFSSPLFSHSRVSATPVLKDRVPAHMSMHTCSLAHTCIHAHTCSEIPIKGVSSTHSLVMLTQAPTGPLGAGEGCSRTLSKRCPSAPL